MKKIIAVIGARPQFIKHFPLERAADGKLDLLSIHTGQHYDQNMSDVFFDQLGMKKPDYQLSLGGGSHGAQTGAMLTEIEKIILKENPDGVLVYGDTNSTLAGSLAAAKLHIPVFHVESGLRSYNKDMPEEINRIMTDHISSLLFVPSDRAVENLGKEGITEGVCVVGDVMKDIVVFVKQGKHIGDRPLAEKYYYATLHRPYNVDEKERLIKILTKLNNLNHTVVFSAHPRTVKRMADFGINIENYKNVHIIEPQAYFENLTYLNHSEALITDSGGMQKEAYWLEVPCFTIRSETEWVETLESGANQLLFEDLTKLGIRNRDIVFNKELYGSGNSCVQIVGKIVEHLKSVD